MCVLSIHLPTHIIHTTAHKLLGLSYGALAITAGHKAFALSLLIRAAHSETAAAHLHSDFHAYNAVTTQHALLMIFAFVMPITLAALTNYALPPLLAIPDMIYPRTNNISLWLFTLALATLAQAQMTHEGAASG